MIQPRVSEGLQYVTRLLSWIPTEKLNTLFLQDFFAQFLCLPLTKHTQNIKLWLSSNFSSIHHYVFLCSYIFICFICCCFFFIFSYLSFPFFFNSLFDSEDAWWVGWGGWSGVVCPLQSASCQQTEKRMIHRLGVWCQQEIPERDNWAYRGHETLWTRNPSLLLFSLFSWLSSCGLPLCFFLLRGEAKRETLGAHFPPGESEWGLLSRPPLLIWACDTLGGLKSHLI